MSSSTVPRDKQVLPLWQEVDIAFGSLGDTVDAASNVLEAFGEVRGDPNAQAAIIGPKLRETYKEVYDRVLALSGHETQTATEPEPRKGPPEDAGEPTDTKESLSGIGHELTMWTSRLEAVRACTFEELEGGRRGNFDDPEKLWGAFYILGDIRDGLWALTVRIDKMDGRARAVSDAS